jgi:urease accessory protein
MRRHSSLLLLLLMGFSSLAEAHSPVKGIGNFYNGMLHPLLVPAHIISLAALGLLAGQQGLPHMRAGMAGFCLALLAGLGLGSTAPEATAETILLATSAVMCALVALQPALPVWLLWPPALLCGLFLGMDSDPAPLRGSFAVLACAGTALGASLVLLCLASLVDWLDKPLQQIAIRIVSAWIGATSILVLSLAFAPIRA